MRSSGVAPALKLVAGDVVAAVENPVHVVTRQHPRPASAAPAAAAATAPVQVTRPAPVHHQAQHRVRTSRPRVVTSRHATTQTASAPSSPIEQGQAKAKAVGHVRKTASHSKPVNGALHTAGKNGSHVKTHGGAADASHGHAAAVDAQNGPPAVPPGQEKKGDAAQHGASADQGGGK